MSLGVGATGPQGFLQCLRETGAYQRGRYRRVRMCGCVFHVQELVPEGDALLAPCGHLYSREECVPASESTVRYQSRPADKARWRKLSHESFRQRFFERGRFARLTFQVGIEPRTPFGAPYHALWTVDGPEAAVSYLQGLVEAEEQFRQGVR